MRSLIFLTATTVIGLFGIIGTIEYSHADTHMTSHTLENIPEPIESHINLDNGNPFWYLGGTPNKAIQNNVIKENPEVIGHVFIPNYPEILENPSLIGQTGNEPDRTCSGSVESLRNLISAKQLKDDIEGLEKPDNIKPKKAKKIIAMGVNWWSNSDAQNNNPNPMSNNNCNVNLEAPSKHPLILTKEIIFTLYNQSDKKAYYFDPRGNITQAQPIPLCTTETINSTTLTLKNDTKMCYGNYNDNMVIVTKKLNGFYGAAKSITTPTIPTALNSDVIETVESYNEKIKQKEIERQKELERQRELDEQKKAYEELLKRLYLPPI